MAPIPPGDDAQVIRHLHQEQERLHQRLKLIETKLGIIYHPRIKIPDGQADHEDEE